MTSETRSINRSRVIRFVLLFLWLLFALFPVYWMVITAFKLQRDIYQGPYVLPFVDFKPTLQAFETIAGSELDAIVRGFRNSLVFAAVSSFFAVVLGAFAGYGLARYRYKYGPFKNSDLSFTIVSQRMMPPIVAVIALFVMFRFVRLQDTAAGMIIVYTWFNLPLTVFLLTDFIGGIPLEIEQAAAVDGYSKLRQIWKVVLPLALPGLAAAYLLAFFFAWNDFLLAFMLTFRDAATLPIVIANMRAQMEPRWWLISAVGIIAIIPPIIAAIVLDRFMERQVLQRGVR